MTVFKIVTNKRTARLTHLSQIYFAQIKTSLRSQMTDTHLVETETESAETEDQTFKCFPTKSSENEVID